MKKFAVKWKEERLVDLYAEVYSSSEEEAISKAQTYNMGEEKGEYFEEQYNSTIEIHEGNAKEL